MAYAVRNGVSGVCCDLRGDELEAVVSWASGAATDTGLLRERNEDRYWADPERGMFLVCDGVGGNAAGEVAAQTAVDVIRASSPLNETDVRDVIARANNRIFDLTAERPELRGMACVLTLAVLLGDELLIGHVGDSRLYLIWNGAIRKLTADHSPVGEDEDAGALSEAEAMVHPRRNEVFRDVGSRPREASDADFIQIRRCRFHRDAAILLCSDGLTDLLTASRVREIAERYDGDATLVASELVAAANRAGGSDNVTALFVAGPEFRGRTSVTRPRQGATKAVKLPSRLTGRLAFLVYGLLLGMLVWMVARR
jgi:serine/threonine protein phosphatase PrpC